jgi:hypothetical protein
MKISFGKFLATSVAALVLARFAMTPYADAAGRGGGGGGGGGGRGGGGGGGARAGGGGGGGAHAGGGGGGGARSGGGGGGRQQAQANNSRADGRTNNVRSNSVNNVNVERNVNINDNRGGWDNDYHPVARAAAVGAAVAVTSAVVGSMVATVPPNCVPVNYGGMIYQQCGSTWYQPQGSQYIVVDSPN